MILILTDPGTRVGIANHMIEINTGDLIRKLPLHVLESVSVFGSIQLSARFIQHCLIREIPIMYFSYTGQYFGRISSQSGQDLEYLQAQLTMINNMEFRQNLAAAILEAKINNQMIVLKRSNVNHLLDRDISFLSKIRKKINAQLSINEQIGHEGIAARVYFAAVSKILPKEFKFANRSKRPPRDPFNSMISLGYTILLHEMIGQIEGVGLSAYGGLVHGNSRKYPSLASDMIEEYRPTLVDSMVISLLKSRTVSREDFDISAEGVFLSKELLRKYLDQLHKKMMTKHKYLPYMEKEVSYRETIYHQAKRMRSAIWQQDAAIYEPIRIR